MAAVKSIYPSAPNPLFFTRSNWYTDPWSRGSYSFNAVGINPATDYTALVGPFYSNKLVFAGEHTSQPYFGTMQGAYNTGLSSVDLVSGFLVCGEFLQILRGMIPIVGNQPYVCMSVFLYLSEYTANVEYPPFLLSSLLPPRP